jgi:hypothetical protein
VADITNLVDNLRKVGSIPTPPVTKVQSDAIRYLTGRLHNIPTLIRLFNLVLVNDLITSLFLVEATSMSDDELLASCTLPFISEWAERALTSHMEVLLGEAGIPLVHHSPFQQFAAANKEMTKPCKVSDETSTNLFPHFQCQTLQCDPSTLKPRPGGSGPVA